MLASCALRRTTALRQSFHLARYQPLYRQVPAMTRLLATAATAPNTLERALKLSPHFQHLDASKLPSGYAQTKTASGVPYAVLEKSIMKSELDDRSYKMIRLENGLEALLVSDPTTDKAAASLCVRVGHLSDPEELQGLAHFCEHLLFMGTEKYPKENEYSEYLAANSGASNAFTGMDETNYHFDVHPGALDGALDRFAQFFIAPLFDPSCTEREIQAVDSENKRNLQSDTWRLYQLEKSLSSKTHAYWRFGTGNLDSLWNEPRKNGLEPRAELLKFHRNYYSSNLCKLAVVGSDSVEQLVEMVVDKFAAAHNQNLGPPLFEGSPFTSDELQKNIFVKTVKDTRLLEMTFPFPDQDPLFSSKPGSFLSHFIGHEGEGSILSYLKMKGWANSLSAGCSPTATGFAFFKVNIELTKEGLQNYQQVAQVVFDYLKLLKSTPPQEWAFKEVAMLSEMAFRFQDKTPPISYVTSLSSWMQKPYPRDLVLSAPFLSTQFDRDQLAGAIASLGIDRCRVTVASQQPFNGLVYDAKEKWYGTQYTIQPFAEEFVQNAATPAQIPDLSLPQQNAFIPEKLDILDKFPVKTPSRQPDLIQDCNKSKLWHKKDDRWWLPRASVLLTIKSPVLTKSSLTSVQARLFTDLVEDSLSEYSYSADLAGLSYGLHAQLSHLILQIEGYNDKLPELHRVVLDRLTNFKVDSTRFAIIKDRLQQGLENFRLGNPYQHASFHLSHFTIAGLFEPEEQLAALRDITADSLQQFIDTIFDETFVEGLVHGNVLRDQAKALMQTAETFLVRRDVLAPEERRSERCLIPSLGSYCFRSPVLDADQLNSSVDVLFYVGDESDPNLRTRVALLAQLASEPCFDQLRTKEQLGYIVQSGNRNSIRFLGFHIIIQSERDTDHQDDRIEAFLVTFRKLLEDMSEDEFSQQRQSLVHRKLEDFKNLSQETSTYWSHIQTGYYDFQRKRADASRISKLTKTDILNFMDEYIVALAPKRSKLAVHLRAQRLTSDAADQVLLAATNNEIPLTEKLQELLKSNPLLAEALQALQQFATSQSLSPEATEQLCGPLRDLISPPKRTNVNYIDKSWRSQMQVGPPAEALAHFSIVP